MSWLRDRSAKADGEAQIGWIARLRQAFARWLFPSPASYGNPPQDDPLTLSGSDPDGGESQSPPRPKPDTSGNTPSDLVPIHTCVDSSDAVAKTPESATKHDQHDGVGRNPSNQGEPSTPEIQDKTNSLPVSPAGPESDTRANGPGSRAGQVEVTAETAVQDRKVDQETSHTEIGSKVTATDSPSNSAAVLKDPTLERTQGLATGSNEGPAPEPPPLTGGQVSKASPIAQPPKGQADLDAAQPIQDVEVTGLETPTAAIQRDRRKKRETSRKRSLGKRNRKPPDGTGKAPRYRPNLRPPPAQAPPREASPSPRSPNSSRGTLEATYRISFLPGGLGLSVSVLLARSNGLPESLSVESGGNSIPLYAIDESLYEPIQPLDDNHIAEGFIAETQEDPSYRWVRSARDLHAFSQRPGIAGFVTVPRVLIGQENVVLCRAEVAATVQQCASATGSDPLAEVSGPGIPEGWHCFRGYFPRRPGDFGDLNEIFLALNPHPDASIQFSGGIASARGKWVLGAPPVIRVLGAVPGQDELTIDGEPARESADAGWTAPGWDAIGTHTVRFLGLSRNYEIERIEEGWSAWSTSDDISLSVCGARVADPNGVQAMAFADGPFWLLGASAGDLALAKRSIHGTSIAAPSFLPVWALPPIRSGPQSPAIALAHRIPPRAAASACNRNKILLWCQLLRAAGPPPCSSEETLWREYRKFARSLRRRLR